MKELISTHRLYHKIDLIAVQMHIQVIATSCDNVVITCIIACAFTLHYIIQ